MMTLWHDVKLLLKPFSAVRVVFVWSHFYVLVHYGQWYPDAAALPGWETHAVLAASFLLMAGLSTQSSSATEHWLATAFAYQAAAVTGFWLLTAWPIGVLFLLAAAGIVVCSPAPVYDGPTRVRRITEQQLDEQVLASKDYLRPTMLVCTAMWSRKCRRYKGLFDRLSCRYDKVDWLEIDVQRFPRAALLCNVRVSADSAELPALVMFQAGKQLRSMSNDKYFTAKLIAKNFELDA